MAPSTYRILLFMKRRPGMSVEDFRAYYEDHHAPLCLQGGAVMSRYVRRYLEPQPHPETGVWEDPPFDVVTELWFDDEAVFRGTLAALTTTVMPAVIVRDEANLFDRSSFRIATVVECESDLGVPGGA